MKEGRKSGRKEGMDGVQVVLHVSYSLWAHCGGAVMSWGGGKKVTFGQQGKNKVTLEHSSNKYYCYILIRCWDSLSHSVGHE